MKMIQTIKEFSNTLLLRLAKWLWQCVLLYFRH